MNADVFLAKREADKTTAVKVWGLPTINILLGSGVSMLITLFAGLTVRVSLFSIFLATTFSLMVGIVFGLWPAQKASGLDPIEALRYE